MGRRILLCKKPTSEPADDLMSMFPRGARGPARVTPIKNDRGKTKGDNDLLSKYARSSRSTKGDDALLDKYARGTRSTDKVPPKASRFSFGRQPRNKERRNPLYERRSSRDKQMRKPTWRAKKTEELTRYKTYHQHTP